MTRKKKETPRIFRGSLPVLCGWEQWVPQKAAGGQTVASFKSLAKKLGFMKQGKQVLRVVLDGNRGGSIEGGWPGDG